MSAIEQSLNDFLLERDDLQQEAQTEHFTVDTIERAEWCMRKLAKLQQEDVADIIMAEREMDRIQLWLEERKKPRQASRDFFEEHLQAFHQKVLLQDEKAKTIKLPHGALKARKLADKWCYDDAAILTWATENGRDEVIRVKREVIKDAVKKILKEDGEIVPGVTVLPQGISFSVEVDV